MILHQAVLLDLHKLALLPIKVRFLTASEVNYDEFRQKVATIDTENCFIRKPVENQKLLDVVNDLMK